MLRNHITEDYLKRFNPEISLYLWTGEDDFDKQKAGAEIIVMNDFRIKGFNVNKLMPELILRESGTVLDADETTTAKQDYINCSRLVIDKIVCEDSGKIITLQGSNDNTTFYDVCSLTVLTDNETVTTDFNEYYKYYRIFADVNSSTVDFRAYIVETKYDLLFAYKELELILRNGKTAENDFDLKANDYKDMYNDLLNSGIYAMDSNNDGIPDEEQSGNVITFTR